MATLRRWQQVQRRPQKRMFSLDRLLVMGGAAAIGFAVFSALQPAPQPGGQIAPGSPEARRIEQQQAAARAQAQRAEEAERIRQRATLKAEEARRQANIFNQRYNTDRMPTGSVNAGAPDAPAPQGFSVVKPALPPGQTGGGFREVKWGKPAP